MGPLVGLPSSLVGMERGYQARLNILYFLRAPLLTSMRCKPENQMRVQSRCCRPTCIVLLFASPKDQIPGLYRPFLLSGFLM